MKEISRESAEIMDIILNAAKDKDLVEIEYLYDLREYNDDYLSVYLKYLHSHYYVNYLASGVYRSTPSGILFIMNGGFTKALDDLEVQNNLQIAQLQLTQKQIKNIKYYKLTTVISIITSITAVAISLFK